MESTVQSNGNKERAIAALLGKSRRWFALSLFFAVVSGLTVQPSLWVTASALLLALVCGGCALYLLRHYNFWYSSLWWLPLLPAFSLVVEPMRTGELSIPAVLHALALGSTFMFAAFWYFRNGLRKWAH